MIVLLLFIIDAMEERETPENYFNLLKNILKENNLMRKPSQIYNVDESGIPLDHQSPHVLTKKGKKKLRLQKNPRKVITNKVFSKAGYFSCEHN